MSLGPLEQGERTAWAVIVAMSDELRRQHLAGLIEYALAPDDFGRVVIKGRLDLAALANATEEALLARET